MARWDRVSWFDERVLVGVQGEEYATELVSDLRNPMSPM